MKINWTTASCTSAIESADYDIDRNVNVDAATDTKSMAIDVMNWMNAHGLSEMNINYNDEKHNALEGTWSKLFGNNSNIMIEKQMIIMQGVPGSGKTQIARLIASGINARVVSNNDFMVDENGEYEFDASRLEEVADRCYEAAEKFVEEGWSVVVDNTNVNFQEAGSFIELGMNNGYRIQIVRTDRSFQECVSENIHNVPDHTIMRRHKMMQGLVD